VSFYIQALLVVPVSIGIYFQNRKYLSVDEAVAYRKKCTERLEAKREKELQRKLDDDPELKAKMEQEKKEKKEEDHLARLKKYKDL
jgi:hypothetical protein